MPVWAGLTILFGCVAFLVVAVWATGWMVSNSVCQCREAGRTRTEQGWGGGGYRPADKPAETIPDNTPGWLDSDPDDWIDRGLDWLEGRR